MRRYVSPILVGVLFLAGCHKSAAPAPPPAADLRQLADNLIKALPEKASTDTQSYALDNPTDLKSLTAALRPYDQALAQGDAALAMGAQNQPFVTVEELNKQDRQLDLRIEAIRSFLVADVAQAQLDYAEGRPEQGLKHLAVACHLCHLLADNPGCILGHVAQVAMVGRTVQAEQNIVVSVPLSATQLRQIAALTKLLTAQVNPEPVYKAEIATVDNSKTKADNRELRRVYDILKDDHSDYRVSLRRITNGIDRTVWPESFATENTHDTVRVEFAASLRQLAEVRILLAALEALAVKDQSKHFPKALPTLGKEARDPFDDQPLAYKSSSDGFTISAQASKKAMPARLQHRLEFTYPAPSPGKAIL